jgi:proprotein convertase subtilisin/kexin type 5
MYLVKNGTCVYLCPSSTYIDSTVNKCLDCHSWCQSCWGPLNTQCNRCNNATNTSSAQTTIYYLISGTSTCSSSCPDLQYIDAKVPNYCQLCSSSCLTCAGNSTTCLTCQTGNFFLNAACIPSCPTGTYQNQTTSACTTCDIRCSACTGGSSTSCQACKTPYFLSYGTTSCITACLNGQYANTTSNACLLCSSICLTCVNSSTTCVTCSLANSITPVYLFNNTCMEMCPIQYFGNDTNATNRICSLCSQ